MATINMNELTKEQIEKAMACKSADELIMAAKEEGFELTKEEAEAYIAEDLDFDLDDEMLAQVSGGVSIWHGKDCSSKCGSHSTKPRHAAVP